MIQDFAGVFVGRQSVRVRAIPIRESVAGKKIIPIMLTGAILSVIVSSLVFSLLMHSVRNELAVQTGVKIEMEKTQQGLNAQRNAMLDQTALVRSAGKLGLYVPDGRQVRRL